MANPNANPNSMSIGDDDMSMVPNAPAIISPHNVITAPDFWTAAMMASSLLYPLPTYSLILVVSRIS